jgi:hypothetical protein
MGKKLPLDRHPYFSHGSASECFGETARHFAAKHLIARSITDWLADRGPQPEILRRCWRCQERGPQKIHKHPEMSVSVDKHHVEGGFKPDVTVFSGDRAILAVEVFATHLVPKEKRDQLRLPWVELDADEVIANHTTWVPREPDGDHLLDMTRPCKGCRDEKAEAEADRKTQLEKAWRKAREWIARAGCACCRTWGSPQIWGCRIWVQTDFGSLWMAARSASTSSHGSWGRCRSAQLWPAVPRRSDPPT